MPRGPEARADRPESSELRQTIHVSISEGLFSQLYTSMAGPGSVFVTKLAIFLGANPLQFGMLSAIGQLSQVFQPLGVALTRSLTRRKRSVILMAALGRSLTPLYGILPFLVSSGASMNAFLAVFLAATAVLAVSANAWMGWIGDMVPSRIRGRFFARRNQVLMLGGLGAGYVFGLAVDMFDEKPGAVAGWALRSLGQPALSDHAAYAFLGLFVLAGALGLFGLSILRRQPERDKEIETEPFLRLALSPLRDANFRRLLLFCTWWMLAVGVGAPFWQPFMIGVLGMSILSIQLYGTASTLAALLSLRLWGRFIDRWGNRNAMTLAIVLGSVNPLFWVLSGPGRTWPIYAEAVLSGTMWAGAGIVATNFVLSVAPDRLRQAYSGLYGAAGGLGMMATMLLSGALMPRPLTLPWMTLHPMQVLFLATAALRLTALIPLSLVKEPEVRPFSAILRQVQQFTKVRVLALSAVLGRSRPAGRGLHGRHAVR